MKYALALGRLAGALVLAAAGIVIVPTTFVCAAVGERILTNVINPLVRTDLHVEQLWAYGIAYLFLIMRLAPCTAVFRIRAGARRLVHLTGI